MHLRGQEIQSQLTSALADASKFTIENTRLLAQTTSLTAALETLKAKNSELSTNLTEAKSKHESEMSSLRRAQAGLQRDRSDLQRHVDELKIELTKRPDVQHDNLEEEIDEHDLPENDGGITPDNQSPAASPQLSPIKNTPSRNAPLELETTKSSLHHAHRLVTNLRSNLHREKTEKVELRRLLAAAQDEVEQLRSKASGSKRAGKRPQVRRPIDLLGNRKARQEVTVQDDLQFLDAPWNDEEASSSAAYVTAQEDAVESDGAFMTATDHEMDETDTDAYRTGLESLPDSDDGELTETGSSSSNRMPSLGYIREFSPSVHFTSDEDDSPIRLPSGPKHRRGMVRGESVRRLASSSFDPPPQPLFQELMEGAALSAVNSPISVMDSPTSVCTAVPFFAARDILETSEIGCQCDPIPEPEPIVIQSAPVIVYKDREKPPATEKSAQSDPIPDPEPIVIMSPPVTVYMERERPGCTDIGTQSGPIPDPEPIIVEGPPVIIYKEAIKPLCTDINTQTDPIPPPEPVIIQSDPIIIPAEPVIITKIVERERPISTDMGIQSDPIPPPEPVIIQSDPVIIQAEPVIITKIVEREKPISADVGIQSDPVPLPEPVIIQSDPIIIPAEPVIITKIVERERPISTDIGVQSDPIPPPEPVIIQSDPVIIPAEPVIITKIVERERPISTDVAIQSDPTPPPEPVIIRPDPIVITTEPVIITKLVERERPTSAEVGIQSDPIPPPEPIIIRPDPVIMTAEPVIITKYLERERPTCAETAIQSDPLPPPAQIIIYREQEKPTLVEIAVQSDPIPDPLPIIVPAEPVIIYRDREVPLSTETGVQCETVVTGVQELGVQSDLSTILESSDKETQTLLGIPLLESYRFNGQSLPPTTLRPKTPITILPSPSAPLNISKPVATNSDEGTPRTVRTIASITDWETPPKSPLRETPHSRRSQPGSPSRGSMRYTDSPSTFTSRVGTSRRYGTILEHPTLHQSPRAATVRSRAHPTSPSKLDQKRPQTISPAHSRMNMSFASRSTTAMSRRTSLSSFESEVEDRFGLNREQAEGQEDGQRTTATDPQVIQSVTTTMIGDFLYKYTRNQMQRSKISDKRHLRFFWIHPYTKTLYWSTDNPAVSMESNRNTRSGMILF